MLKKIVLVSIVCINVYAQDLSLGLNSDQVEIAYRSEVGNNINIEMSGFIQNNDDDDDNNDTTKYDNSGEFKVGLRAEDYINNYGGTTKFGIGLGIVSGKVENHNYTGIPIIMSISQRLNLFILSANIDYSPKILCMKDTNSYKSYSLQAAYDIVRNIDIFIATKSINVNVLDDIQSRYKNSITFGFKINY